ncbi:acyl-CoA synthetase [Staphylococcus gallinarum]|uniref:Acyl-CoA synthetase n=1 Tax=Staphylococcus gallinarum TaxID=1293 RepID=A0A380FAH6_STAGA|nr:acyl-CoA synthetase [Staphylococcus gallinarum]
MPEFNKKFTGMGHHIINGYGLTEAPLVMVNTPENSINKPGSIGKPINVLLISVS